MFPLTQTKLNFIVLGLTITTYGSIYYSKKNMKRYPNPDNENLNHILNIYGLISTLLGIHSVARISNGI